MMEVRFSRLNAEKPMLLAIAVPAAMILMAETFLFVRSLEACVALHLLNIFMCVLAPIFLNENPIIWQSFSLVSILRVLNLGMPVFDTYTLYWIPMIYLPTIVMGYLVIRDESRTIRSYLGNFKRFFNTTRGVSGWKSYYLPLGLLIAILLANLEFKVLGSIKLVPDLSAGSLVLLFAVMVFFVGLGEELVFRYVLQTRLQASVGILASLILTSIIFAAMHSGYASLTYMGYVFFVSVFLGTIYHKTHSLAFVALIHGTLNFFLFSLLPYGHLVFI